MSDNDEVVKKESQDAAPEEQEVENNDSGASAEPDWKELLHIERQRADKAESDRDNYKEGLLSHKRQEKARKQEGDDTAEDLDDKIARGLEKAIAPLAEALQGNKLEQILGSIVTDPAKREYVKELYSTRIQRTGTSDSAIRADLEAALDLANAKRFAKENSELKRMQNNSTYVPPTGGGGSADTNATKKVHKWTSEQEAALERRAMNAGISDVEKYKANAWQQFQKGSAFDLQPSPKK